MSQSVIYQWIKQKAIKPEAISEALVVAEERPSPDAWLPFLRTLLMVLGVLALAVALLFLLAYNWQVMGRVVKFAMVQTGLVLAVMVPWLIKMPALQRRFSLSPQSVNLMTVIAMVVTTLLIGGLLALFGQTYQTGADPWQLFALWALLISVLVVTSGQAIMWLTWSFLINLALQLFVASQPFWLTWFRGSGDFIWMFFMVNAVLWLLLELLTRQVSITEVNRIPESWYIAADWGRQVQSMGLLICLTFMGFMAIFEWQDYGLVQGLVALLGFLGLYVYYRYKRPDLLVLAFWMMAIITLLVTLVVRLFDNLFDEFVLLFLALFIISLTTGAVAWLKSIQKEWRNA